MRIYCKKHLLTAPLLVALALLSGGKLPAQTPPTDAMIADAVSTELRYSDLLLHDGIELAVEDGIVSLIGSVPSITMSDRIEGVVSTVRGVRSIVNRLAIEPPEISAAALTARIEDALANNAATDAYQITASADEAGQVTLDGSVDSWAEFELAEIVAGSVAGVRSVDNRIAVDAVEHYRGGGEIQAEISERLRWDARVEESLINVLVRDGGRVTLSGTVGSLAEKRLATSLAYVSGVREVDAEHLNVESWARDEDRRLGVERDVADGEIRDAIERALVLDSRVAASEIDIEVSDNDVWLRGEIGSIASRDAAGRTASNTYGVGQVHNLLTVEPLMLDDADLLRRVMDTLTNFEETAQLGIEISVLNGEVRMIGDVANGEQYRRLDEAIRNTRGVRTVVNGLTIRGEQPRIAANPFMTSPTVLMPVAIRGASLPTDRELYAAVESELFWSPFVDSDEVSIDVNEGIVTLTGTVGSVNEATAAAENAFEAGAVDVRNRLEIE